MAFMSEPSDRARNEPDRELENASGYGIWQLRGSPRSKKSGRRGMPRTDQTTTSDGRKRLIKRRPTNAPSRKRAAGPGPPFFARSEFSMSLPFFWPPPVLRLFPCNFGLLL